MTVILFALYLAVQLVFFHNNLFNYLSSLYHPFLNMLVTMLVIAFFDALYEFGMTWRTKNTTGFFSVIVFLFVVILSVVTKKNLFAEYPWLLLAIVLSLVNEMIDVVLLYPIFTRIVGPMMGNNNNHSQPR